MRKRASGIFLILLGVVTLVVAIVTRASIHTAGFVVLIIIAVFALIGGIAELFVGLAPNKMQQAADASEKDKPQPKYSKKAELLSRPERIFYENLKNILDRRVFDIYPQMALVCVIEKLTLNSYRNELFRIADFCIADARTSEPLLLIELNDASHLKADRKARDEKVRDLCQKAGISLIAFTLEEAADLHFVARVIKKNL